jgi:hypothetical protein
MFVIESLDHMVVKMTDFDVKDPIGDAYVKL